MNSWRNIPLMVGASYRVEADVVSVHDSLRSGQVVMFLGADYSHYDNLTVLAFREHSTEQLLYLWWFDNDADIDWRQLVPVTF